MNDPAGAPLDIDSFREELQRLRAELADIAATGEAAADTVMLDQTRVGRLSRMDAMQAQAISQEANRRRAQAIVRIRAALKRIESGDFGLCTECDEAIDIRRLKLDPAASMCIRCASDAESA